MTHWSPERSWVEVHQLFLFYQLWYNHTVLRWHPFQACNPKSYYYLAWLSYWALFRFLTVAFTTWLLAFSIFVIRWASFITHRWQGSIGPPFEEGYARWSQGYPRDLSTLPIQIFSRNQRCIESQLIGCRYSWQVEISVWYIGRDGCHHSYQLYNRRIVQFFIGWPAKLATADYKRPGV